MSLIFSDRVKEVSTTSGTENVSLGGAYSGFQTFAFGIGDGNETYYVIENQSQWEVGRGTYASGVNSLSRDEVFASSNNNNKIILSGTSNVFCSYVAKKAIAKDKNGYIDLSNESGILYSNAIISNTGVKFEDVEISGSLTLASSSIIDESGRIGIKQNTPIYDLDVYGSGRLQSIYLTSGIYFPDGTFQSTSIPSSVVNEFYPFFITSPTTIDIPIYFPKSAYITAVKNLMTSSGTLDLSIKINGVSVSGLNSLAVTSVAQSPSATSAYTVNNGDTVAISISNPNSASNLHGTLCWSSK